MSTQLYLPVLSTSSCIDGCQRSLPTWVGAVADAGESLLEDVTRYTMPVSAKRFVELTNTVQYDGLNAVKAFDFDYPVGIESTVRSMVRSYRSKGRL